MFATLAYTFSPSAGDSGQHPSTGIMASSEDGRTLQLMGLFSEKENPLKGSALLLRRLCHLVASSHTWHAFPAPKERGDRRSMSERGNEIRTLEGKAALVTGASSGL